MAKKYLIVGGVAGGASVAAKLRRLNEDDHIVMFEKGPHVSFSNCCLPYYLSGTIETAEDLVLMTPQMFDNQYNIDARVNNEVISIDKKNKEVEVKNLLTNEIYKESYDKLILSPGAQPIKPNLPGIEKINSFTIRNVVDIDKLQQSIQSIKPKHITVVGAGFIGIETVENLVEAGYKVSLVQSPNQVLKQFDYDLAQIMHKELYDKGVELILGDRVESFNENELVLKSGKKISSEVVIFGIGVTPDSILAKNADLKLGKGNTIWVDHNYKTSDKDIYAVGDAIQVYNPITRDYGMLALAGPALKQARAVAMHIHNIPVIYPGYIGSSVVKCFDYNGATTGINEKVAKDMGLEYECAFIVPKDKVGLMPDSEELHFKLLFERPTGRILGAQAIGRGNVDKRIDVIATAMRAKATIDHLTDLELCYAPPFGSARDAVNMAGFVASNLLHDTFKQKHMSQLRTLHQEGALIIDVRERDEYELGHIKGAKLIPLSELRDRLDEIPKDKEVYLHCRSGQRSYNAVLALQNRGWDKVYNLSGGFIELCFYEYFRDKTTPREPIVSNYDFK